MSLFLRRPEVQSAIQLVFESKPLRDKMFLWAMPSIAGDDVYHEIKVNHRFVDKKTENCG